MCLFDTPLSWRMGTPDVPPHLLDHHRAHSSILQTPGMGFFLAAIEIAACSALLQFEGLGGVACPDWT